MLKTLFVACSLAILLFGASAHAGPEVTVVNTTDNPANVAVVGEADVNVVSEPGTPRDVNIVNSSVPVTMTETPNCNVTINGINMAQGDVSSVSANVELVNLVGPGAFVAARVTFDATWDQIVSNEVVLAIDGRTVVQESLNGLFYEQRGLFGYNPLWVSLVHGGSGGATSHVVSIRFPLPVSFESSLSLALVVNTPFPRVRGTVIYGE